MKRLIALVFLTLPASTFAQSSDAALKDRVEQLIEKLNSKDESARAAAEKSLIGLGPKALPLLPDTRKVTGDDAKARLEKIRMGLIEEQEKAALVASKITIKGKGIRLTEAMKQMQIQSGNRITDLREANGAEVTNPALDLDIVDKPFFEALDMLGKKAEISYNYYTGDGTIGIMAGAADLPDQIGLDTPPGPMIVYSGPFRIQFKQYVAAKDITSGTTSANAEFEVAWEPRLRPMLLALKADQIAIVDDRGEPVMPSVMGESSSVVLRQESPVAVVNVNMTAPDRKAQTLKSFKVKADVSIPAGVRSFKFPSLDVTDSTIKQGDVAVTLESSEVDEQIWKVRVNLDMPGEGPAFESYRQGLFNNRIWLQKADGSRFEHNGGLNNTGADGGKLGFEYLFVEVPGKLSSYGLVYETPSKVLVIPLEFEFKDVKLP